MESVLTKCQGFRQELHKRQPDTTDLMEVICLAWSEQQVNLDQIPGEMAQFLRNYMKLVVSLLRLIRGSRQCEFQFYLGALEEQVKYYFAHDLYKYARLIPVHLAQTCELKTTDPETWDALKKGDLVVSKSGVPFTDLFVDQTLEQKIRDLKVAGGITGITQHEEALKRYLLIVPELTRCVKEFQEIHGIGANSSSDAVEHYQLAGTVVIRTFKNAAKIKECILKHCQENPFISQIKLMNIVSNMAVPDEGKRVILLRDEKGEARFREFVSTRILTATANKSIWDPVVKMKLKGFTTMQRKTTCKGTEKIVKI